MLRPPRGIFSTGHGKHTFKILTKRPIQTVGEGSSQVVDSLTLAMVRAYTLTALAPERKF